MGLWKCCNVSILFVFIFNFLFLCLFFYCFFFFYFCFLRIWIILVSDETVFAILASEDLRQSIYSITIRGRIGISIVGTSLSDFSVYLLT